MSELTERPAEDPRTRLLAHGSRSLSDAELLSILIGASRNGDSALDLGRDLLARSRGLASFAGREQEEWIAEPGLGPAKTAIFMASVELARRIARADVADRDPMQEPGSVAQYLGLRYASRDQEIMGSLYLDARNRLICEGEIFRGTINRAAAEPRSILKRGLLVGATGVVLFHTHPSGDPSPSAEDIAFTRRLAEAGDIVGVRLVDHLILGSATRWVSLKARGVM